MTATPAVKPVRKQRRKRLNTGGTIGAALAAKLGTENVQGYVLDQLAKQGKRR